MADAPLFSIIIPTYNNLQLFCQALQSVRRQTVQDYEVIVVDDSTDNAIEEFVRQNPLPQLRYHHNVPPRGAVSNWNYGLSLTGGQYVILLHHDEAFESDTFLTELKKAFERGAEVTVSNVHLAHSPKPSLLYNWVKSALVRFPHLLFLYNYIGPCACVGFKRELVQYFNTSLQWAVDYEWYYRLLSKGKTVFLAHNFICSYDGHADQISNNMAILDAIQADYYKLRAHYRQSWFIVAAAWTGKTLYAATHRKK